MLRYDKDLYVETLYKFLPINDLISIVIDYCNEMEYEMEYSRLMDKIDVEINFGINMALNKHHKYTTIKRSYLYKKYTIYDYIIIDESDFSDILFYFYTTVDRMYVNFVVDKVEHGINYEIILISEQ